MEKLKFYHWLIIGFIGIVIIGSLIYWRTNHQEEVLGIEDKIVNTPIDSPSAETTIIDDRSNPTNSEDNSIEKTNTNESTPKSSNTIEQPIPTPVVQDVPFVNTKPACDEAKRIAFTTQYNTDIAQAVQKRDKLLRDANAEYASAGDRAREKYKDIWDPEVRGRLVADDISFASRVFEQAKSSANSDFNSTEMYLTTMYNLDLQSISCTN